MTARRINVLEEFKKEIEEKYKGTKVYPVKLDVSKPDEVRGLVKGLPQEVQNIDILLNNAYSLVYTFLIAADELKEWNMLEIFQRTIHGL